MLCYAMLCYAMLCYAMLCYAMLCHLARYGSSWSRMGMIAASVRGLRPLALPKSVQHGKTMWKWLRALCTGIICRCRSTSHESDRPGIAGAVQNKREDTPSQAGDSVGHVLAFRSVAASLSAGSEVGTRTSRQVMTNTLSTCNSQGGRCWPR